MTKNMTRTALILTLALALLGLTPPVAHESCPAGWSIIASTGSCEYTDDFGD